MQIFRLKSAWHLAHEKSMENPTGMAPDGILGSLFLSWTLASCWSGFVCEVGVPMGGNSYYINLLD